MTQKMGQLGVLKNSLCFFLLLLACNSNQSPRLDKNTSDILEQLITPNFNQDSAHTYIYNQVAFGPRVPNSLAHENCYQYLANSLERFGAHVITQRELVKRYDGETLAMKNIIGSYNPNNHNRVLLCAHWDSRFIADNDINNMDKPILGANVEGRGVGVLLEIARQISLNQICSLQSLCHLCLKVFLHFEYLEE